MQVLETLSKENVKREFGKIGTWCRNGATGFIASNDLSETTTLGRNGSNLLGAFIGPIT